MSYKPKINICKSEQYILSKTLLGMKKIYIQRWKNSLIQKEETFYKMTCIFIF